MEDIYRLWHFADLAASETVGEITRTLEFTAVILKNAANRQKTVRGKWPTSAKVAHISLTRHICQFWRDRLKAPLDFRKASPLVAFASEVFKELGAPYPGRYLGKQLERWWNSGTTSSKKKPKLSAVSS
jgi:hypothetical protein